jgi:hypothetical protein
MPYTLQLLQLFALDSKDSSWSYKNRLGKSMLFGK